jgi:hypothetical protein
MTHRYGGGQTNIWIWEKPVGQCETQQTTLHTCKTEHDHIHKNL